MVKRDAEEIARAEALERVEKRDREDKEARDLERKLAIAKQRRGSRSEMAAEFEHVPAECLVHVETLRKKEAEMEAHRPELEILLAMEAQSATKPMAISMREKLKVMRARHGRLENEAAALRGTIELKAAGFKLRKQAGVGGSIADVRDVLFTTPDALDDVNLEGKSALHGAAMYALEEVVDVLLAAQASVDIADSRGWTPLMYAAGNGHTGTCKKLLSAGADLNVAANATSKIPGTNAHHFRKFLLALVACLALLAILPRGDTWQVPMLFTSHTSPW